MPMRSRPDSKAKWPHRLEEPGAAAQRSGRTQGRLSLAWWVLGAGPQIDERPSLSREEDFLNIARRWSSESRDYGGSKPPHGRLLMQVGGSWETKTHDSYQFCKLFIWLKGVTNECITFKPLQRKPLDSSRHLFLDKSWDFTLCCQ